MAPTPATDATDAPAIDVDAVMASLMDEFKRRHGREATEAEVKSWFDEISAAIADGGL